jgi:hypothetical protein
MAEPVATSVGSKNTVSNAQPQCRPNFQSLTIVVVMRVEGHDEER